MKKIEPLKPISVEPALTDDELRKGKLPPDEWEIMAKINEIIEALNSEEKE